MQSEECAICLKHRAEGPPVGEGLLDDELVLAFHAPAESYLGHVFVEARRHAPTVDALTDEEASAVGIAVTRLAAALRAEGAEHVYAVVLGHHFAHFHEHVVARWPGAPREYWGLNVDEWPQAPRGDEAGIAAFADRLRTRLQTEQRD